MPANFVQIIVFKTGSCDYVSIYATAHTHLFHTDCSDITDSSKIKTQ